MLSVCSRSFHTIFVLILQVTHSQRLSEAPLSPWIIIQPDGKVLAAHCNCMAGLGESCTHVAALLFSIEATVKVRESQTVTDEKSYWLPASVKGISYGALKDIVEHEITNLRTNSLYHPFCLSCVYALIYIQYPSNMAAVSKTGRCMTSHENNL